VLGNRLSVALQEVLWTVAEFNKGHGNASGDPDRPRGRPVHWRWRTGALIRPANTCGHSGTPEMKRLTGERNTTNSSVLSLRGYG